MTTPQNELYNLSYKIQRLTEFFEETDEDLEDIFNIIFLLKKQSKKIIDQQEKLENQLNIIIKLLGKNEH